MEVEEGWLKDQLLQAIAPRAFLDGETLQIWTDSHPNGDPVTLFIGWRLQLEGLAPILPSSIDISPHSCRYENEKKTCRR